MSQTVEATFDGSVFRPDALPAMEPNTRVRLTLEVLPVKSEEGSFLDTAESLRLQGPSDWSANLDHYLYGQRDDASR